MPGIVGLLTKMPREWAERQLLRMVDTLHHEPFYVTGTWTDEVLGVYVGWVARKDSFCDGMPLSTEGGDVVLVFAGEDFPEPGTARRLKELTAHFMSQGADSFTAGRQALAMLYRRTTEQAQVLAYTDDFWLISIIFLAILPLIPLMRRVHAEQNERARESSGRVEALPVPEE